MTWAALLLSAALLTVPSRHRPVRPMRPGPRWTPGRMAVSLSFAAMVTVWLLPPTVAIAVGVAVGTALICARRRRLAARDAKALHATESGLEVLVGELRVGVHPVRAFSTAGGELDDAVGGMFEAVAARARLGMDLAPALRGTGPVAPQWSRIAGSWELAHRHGLAVADLLEACRMDLQERQRFTASVNAGLAGARATAAVLTGLPLVGVALGQLIGARPLLVLFSGGLGGALLVAGVMLACVGLLWSDQITGKALR